MPTCPETLSSDEMSRCLFCAKKPVLGDRSQSQSTAFKRGIMHVVREVLPSNGDGVAELTQALRTERLHFCGECGQIVGTISNLLQQVDKCTVWIQSWCEVLGKKVATVNSPTTPPAKNKRQSESTVSKFRHRVKHYVKSGRVFKPRVKLTRYVAPASAPSAPPPLQEPEFLDFSESDDDLVPPDERSETSKGSTYYENLPRPKMPVHIPEHNWEDSYDTIEKWVMNVERPTSSEIDTYYAETQENGSTIKPLPRILPLNFPLNPPSKKSKQTETHET